MCTWRATYGDHNQGIRRGNRHHHQREPDPNPEATRRCPKANTIHATTTLGRSPGFLRSPRIDPVKLSGVPICAGSARTNRTEACFRRCGRLLVSAETRTERAWQRPLVWRSGQKGYDPESSRVSYLLSDTSESPQDSGLVPVDDGAYCRDGSPNCDRHTLRTMYTLAKCTKGAILTATSTFGACIAGLGRVPRLARVTTSGSCQELATSTASPL